MKKHLYLSLFVLLSNFASAEESRQVSHTLVLSEPDKPASLAVSLFDGSITVVGHNGNQVVVEATIERLSKVNGSISGRNSAQERWVENNRQNQFANSQSSQSSQNGHNTIGKENKKLSNKASRLKGLKRVANTAVQLEIQQSHNSVSIETMNRNQKVELMVKVPFSSDVELELHRGDDIKVENVHGSIEIMNSRGSITAVGIKGPIVAECARNDLVVIFDEFSTKKPSSLNAHRGNIDVSLPKKSKVAIEVKSYQGEIYSGIDAVFENVDSVKNRKSNGQQITIGDAMVAKLNDGTQKLLLNTYRGDILIRKNKQVDRR